MLLFVYDVCGDGWYGLAVIGLMLSPSNSFVFGQSSNYILREPACGRELEGMHDDVLLPDGYVMLAHVGIVLRVEFTGTVVYTRGL